MSKSAITFSNPRQQATFQDWPLGGNKRGEMNFAIQAVAGRGYRIRRWTGTCKPKVTTYGGKAVIVEGSDGRTYIVQHAGNGYGFINVWRSDFMQFATVWPSDRDASVTEALVGQTFEELSKLIESAYV